MDLLWAGSLALLLLLPLLAALYVWALRRRRPAAVRYSSLSLVREALPRASRLRRHVPFALFLAAVGSLVVALARPAAIVAVPTNQTTVMLAIDVSGSMCSSDIPPSRLQAAEAAASRFVDEQSATTQIGLVAFSGFAEVVQTPTNDRSLLEAALQGLLTGRMTAIGSGILTSIDAISQIDHSVAPSQTDTSTAPAPQPVAPGDYAPDIIVVLTDGVNNAGPSPVDAAQQAADRGVRVYTIGFGTANGGPLSPTCSSQFLGREPGTGGFGGGFGGGGGGNGFRRGIDDATLQQVASMTGGKYYPAENASQLEGVFQNLPTSLITKHEAVEVTVAFVVTGTVLAALAVVLGRAWRPLP
jgi:Ca-activated chloride channel homolog